MLRRSVQIALVLGVAWAPNARAESSLRLAVPAVYGVVPASSYDESGQRVGKAHLVIEKLDGGNVRIFSESGIDGGARTVAMAELKPVEGGRALQLVSEESRSFNPDGTPLGVLSIDHDAALARCTNTGAGGTTELALPEADRVANVPLNLLFLPLVRGETERTTFQLFLCRGERPRLVDFEAQVVRRDSAQDGLPRVVEVRYSPDFGAVLSIVAQNFVPRLSFWFDPDAPLPWIAHRLPLYAQGPEITVIREGVPPSLLAD